MADSTPKQEPPYGLRMSPDLKARVKASADANNRSMNAEIVATLEEKYPPPRDPLPPDMRLLVDYLRLVESAETDEERTAFLESVNEGMRSDPSLSAFRMGVTTDLDGQIVPYIGRATESDAPAVSKDTGEVTPQAARLRRMEERRRSMPGRKAQLKALFSGKDPDEPDGK